MNDQVENIVLQNEDVQTSMSSDASAFKIAFCDTHQLELEKRLEESLVARLQANKRPLVNPRQAMLKVSHVLFSLAARTIGTDDLVKHRCPVCALRNFDYILGCTQIALGD